VLRSLHNRPRGRALAAALNRLSEGRVAPEQAGEPAPAPAFGFDVLERSVQPREPQAHPMTDALYERLDGSQLEALDELLSPEHKRELAAAEGAYKRDLTLAYICHYELEPALEATGLKADWPPEEVHSTSRGAEAKGGSYYWGDLIADALAQSGFKIESAGRVLDFGCSSGRVIRVFPPLHPDVEWHGCDPNEGAIRWAQQHLPEVRFAVSPQEPPLPFPDEHFDVAYAVSIWSHFGESAALRWLEEMRRLIRPGGRLLITVQGYNSIRHFGSHGLWSRSDLERAAAELYSRGFSYWDVFGESGDFGVKSPEWGMAYLNGDWLLEHVTPAWAILLFQPGRGEGNQDVLVLRRQ
jgi:SAM-dependent methyltransferase